MALAGDDMSHDIVPIRLTGRAGKVFNLRHQTNREIERLTKKNTRLMVAELDRTSAFLATFRGDPEQDWAEELAWIERHGDAAMELLHRDALAEDRAREWGLWEDAATARIEEVFPT